MDPTFSGEAEASCCYATVSSSPPKRRAGRTKFNETRHPVFKGVRQRGRKGRWVCELREPNKKSRLWLGTYPTAEMAARAHDVAAMALRGRSACLNFADSASLLSVPDASAGTRAIQRAAAAAARALPLVPSAPNTPSGSTITTETTFPMTPLSMMEFSDACSLMELDLDLGMLGYYYFSMAEELPADRIPPAAAGCCWDDAVGGADLPLWSYSM